MYEQQRKQMGLPTTEEEQQMEMLKKAWDAEGSPFKGQPFDPSKFNLPGSNSMNLNLDKWWEVTGLSSLYIAVVLGLVE